MGAVFKLQTSATNRHLISIIIMDTKILFGLLLAVVIASALPAGPSDDDKSTTKKGDTTTTKKPDEDTTTTKKGDTTTTKKGDTTTEKTPKTTTTSGSTTINFSLTTLIAAVLMRTML